MIIENKDFNRRIRSERERIGLSQAEMALALGVSLSTQGAYEAGMRVPDLIYLARLSQMEGVDAMYLLTGLADGQTSKEPFNWVLHDQISQAIEIWEQNRGLIVPHRKKMDALRFLYTQFRATGQFDDQTTSTLMDMVGVG